MFLWHVRAENELRQQALFEDSRDLVTLLQSPIIKADKKQSILDAVLRGHIGELTASYLQILLKKGREGLVRDMVREGQTQLRILRNIQSVTVTTAVALTDELGSNILAQVSKVHQGEVDLTEKLGFVMKLNDSNTVKTLTAFILKVQKYKNV